MQYARYPDYSFSGDGRTFDMVWVGGAMRDYKLANLYVRDASGGMYGLHELKEDTVQCWIQEEPDALRRDRMVDHVKDGAMEQTMYRFPYRNLLFFSEGKLVEACISNAERSPFTGLALARCPDCEFVTLPMTREEMVRVFGEPYEYKESRRIAH